jgi:hypothetical protein
VHGILLHIAFCALVVVVQSAWIVCCGQEVVWILVACVTSYGKRQRNLTCANLLGTVRTWLCQSAAMSIVCKEIGM